MMPLHVFRLGPLRLTPYGACAAMGVVLGMTLSGRLAPRRGVSAEAAWDAGLFAILCCFVSSRLLLVLGDTRAFLRYPVLVLSLPSLTIGGMLLAGIASFLYLRRKRLPILWVLDAFTAGATLLGAFLELGHWLDGSEPGMPVQLPGGGLVFRPVALWGVLAAATMTVVFAGALVARPRLLQGQPGRLAAGGLVLGGLTAFCLDLASLPVTAFSNLPLEPGEIVALLTTLAGGVLWALLPRPAWPGDTVENESRGGGDGSSEPLGAEHRALPLEEAR